MITRVTIKEDVLALFKELRGDWESSDEDIREDSYVLEDLGFESIDAVALGTSIEEKYQRPLPFAQFLLDLQEQEKRDFTVGQLIDFVARELNTAEVPR
jgi:acyl carrier protein